MFNNLNSVLLEGNLIQDPALEYTTKGTAYCKFCIASNRFFKQDDEYQKEVSFFDVITWYKQAELCGEYLKKGRGVRLVGRIKQERWKSQDGKTRTKVRVIADHVEFKPRFKNNNNPEKEENNENQESQEKTAVQEPVF